MPVRAIADTRLTSLDLRCLAVVALHDGMSLVKGSGMGCYAKAATLAELVRTDISNFSKSLNRLIKHGYIVREPQQGDRRRFTHRVVYGDDDSWRADQQSGSGSRPEIVGETTNFPDEIDGEIANDHARMVGEPTNNPAEIVGDAEYLSYRELSKNRSHYISLNEELNSVETGEINSVETAHLAFRETLGDEADWTSAFIDDVLGSGREKQKKDGAKAQAASGSLVDHLPSSFSRISSDAARLTHFEAAFAKVGRSLALIDSRERQLWTDWLLEVAENFAGEPTGQQAQRLWEEVAYPEC